MIQKFFAIALCVGVAGSSYFLHNVASPSYLDKFNSPNPDNQNREVPLEENFLALTHRLNPEVTRILTFGQLPILVDFLWLRGLQDDRVTTRARWPKGEHPAVYYDFDLATSLDPCFYQSYHWGASFLSVIRNDFRGGVALLEKANQWRKLHLPNMPSVIKEREWMNEWTIPFALTYHYLFPLHDLPRASQLIEETSLLENSPQFLRLMKARLVRPTGIYEIGENLLVTLVKRETNEIAKAELEKTGQNLRVAKFIRETNESWRKSKTSAAKFLEENPVDPWGGKLSFNQNNQVITSTPYEPAFGLTGLETSLN